MRDSLTTAFRGRFGSAPTVLSFAPGRVELLGNHTDYNEGLTLSYAVRQGTYLAAAPAADGLTTVVRAADGMEVRLDADADPAGEPGWALFARGLHAELDTMGIQVPPFQSIFDGDLPLSSGMSSSASLTICLAQGMLELAGVEFEASDVARLGQRVENEHVGAPTGLLDQLSSLLGRDGHALRLDFRSLSYAHVPIPAGVTFLAFNTRVVHDLSDEYAHRRATCERAVAALRRAGLELRSLGELGAEALEQHREHLSDLQYRRSHHVVHESERVREAVAAMAGGDTMRLGELMHCSHDSSRFRFANSCRELDALVDLAQDLPGHVGARLSGGGFGGITIHAVRHVHADAYSQRLGEDFEQLFGHAPAVIPADSGPGAWSESL